jgi:hypothetical protein
MTNFTSLVHRLHGSIQTSRRIDEIEVQPPKYCEEGKGEEPESVEAHVAQITGLSLGHIFNEGAILQESVQCAVVHAV